MQIILNQSEVEAAVQAYVDDQINLAGDINIVINADGTASVGINEEVHEDTPPVGVEKKTRRSRKNPQEAKHRPVEPEPEEAVEEVKVEETQTSTGGQNESSTPDPEEAVAEPEAQEEVVQEEVKAEEPAEKPATKPSLFAGLKRS
ncbi:hypothetical protein U9527_20875 [Escherichia coli]